MSTNKTETLTLHSWVKTDPFRMEEFNENFSAIDAAVGALRGADAEAAASVAAALPKLATGSYAGRGGPSAAQTRAR